MQEFKESGGGQTITFEDSGTGSRVEIFVKPDTRPVVSEAVFKMDEPPGVTKDPEHATIDGASATTFNGHNDQMGDTREYWFLHGGYLYEVATYRDLGKILSEMMSSWEFL